MPSEDEFVDATREGMRVAASRGVVAIHDKDGWLGAAGIFQRVAERDGLTLRVWQSIPYERLPELEALAIHSGIGDAFLRIGYLKAFMDGTLGSQTAWMLDGSGVVITSGAELAEVIREGARLGWPVGVHAIGDRANREALDAFESTREVWAPLGLRHRIEHAQCLAPEDVGRFAALGIACSVQFSHAPSDRDLAERFWADKVDGAYAFRSLWSSGALVANGSDAPVEELDPLAGIRAGVLRTIDDRPAWHPEQCLTIEEALVATCVNPAWLSGDERRRGKLLPGYLADLVVLSRDPLACPARRARDGRGRRDDGRRALGAQRSALVAQDPEDGVSAACSLSSCTYNQLVASRTMLPVHAAPTCSVAGAAEIVGSKWTVLIVHDLSEGPRRFTELERSCAGISPRTLAERLRWLEAEEIVARQSYPESPPRVEYALTEKGRALLPVVHEMRRFGHHWLGCGVHDT